MVPSPTVPSHEGGAAPDGSPVEREVDDRGRQAVGEEDVADQIAVDELAGKAERSTHGEEPFHIVAARDESIAEGLDGLIEASTEAQAEV